MKLDAAGREYVTWPITGAPSDAAAVEFSFDSEATWHAATWNTDKTAATLLIAGPDATPPAAGQVTLAVGRHLVVGRLTDTPEVVIRASQAVIDVARQT